MTDLAVYGLSTSKKLATNVAKNLKIELANLEVARFADGELIIKNETSVRGKKVFVIQATSSPVNDSIMELLIFIDSLRRASAGEINVIIPYFGYSRQDRKTHGRQPITAALVARLLEEAGVQRVIVFDLHASQIQGFFKIPVDELKAFGLLGDYVNNKLKIKNYVIVAPDHGGIVRARSLAKFLNKNIAVIDKRKIGKNRSIASTLLGNVKGKNCIIYDDIVDTGGTIIDAYKILKEHGAKDIYVLATHGILSKRNDGIKVVDKLMNIGIKNLVITNSIENQESKFLKIVDLAKPISGVIKTHINNKSITNYFVSKYNTEFFDKEILSD